MAVAVINKINSLAIASVAKVSSLAKASMAKINSLVNLLFTDDNAVAKSITTGTGQAVYISDSDGSYNFDHNDPVTVSFWIKPGWSSSLNTNVYLFASGVQGATSFANATDKFRFWYNESNNRFSAGWRSDGNNRRNNFWLFHSNTGNYAAAYGASGLGSSYWSAANRGNTGDDDYTLITVTRGTTNSGASSNLKLYWNATDCGVGYYASGNAKGTPNMSNDDKQIALGSDAWTFTSAGNSTETKFNGVTIWDKVLDATEITELYNSGTPMNVASHSAVSNLVGWWNFESDGANEVSGGPEFDVIAGNSNVEAK